MTLISGSLAVVMLEQAAEPFLAEDAACGRRRVEAGFRQGHVAEPLMGALLVVVVKELGHKVAQVPFTQDYEVIQTLDLKGLCPAFSEGVCLQRRLHPVRAMAMECSASFIRFIRAAASSFPS